MRSIGDARRAQRDGNAVLTTAAFLLGTGLLLVPATAELPPTAEFEAQTDLIWLRYNHVPDRDAGQNTAADRKLLDSLVGRELIPDHAIAVSDT